MAESLKPVYGIDLGTTYSCIAVVDEAGKPVVLRNLENQSVTPSVVFFDGDQVIVGHEAKKHSRLYPHDVVEMVKRSMGEPHYLFEHQASGKTYRAEEISAYILRKMVGDAEQAIGDRVTDVVITCPAYFGVNQREATANAGKIAGLTVHGVINEPTAAAISYGMDRSQDQTVLVYDLGGGTFDVTMIEVKEQEIRVVCTGGDHNLGGKNWDEAVVTWLAQQYQEQTGTTEDILEDAETLQDLLLQAEDAKKTLSTRDRTRLRVTYHGQSLPLELSREKFDELTAPWLERTVELTREMLAQAAARGCQRFDKVLLVGGSTRMPQVTARLQRELNVPCELYDPDESVAKGAAIYGWKLALDERIKSSIAQQTGQAAENVDLGKVDARTLEQAQQEVIQQFALPPGKVEKLVGTRIVNVTSKTFGIVVLDAQAQERVSNLIKVNDPVPAEKSGRYGTVHDNQGTVEVRLMENLSSDDTTDIGPSTEIGRAELQMPAGLKAGSAIAVTFRLNEQGRLEAEAKELTSSKAVNIVVETASVMSREEVQQAQSRALVMDIS